MDQGITQEHRERVARPSNVKGPASASSQGDNRRVTWNANTYVDKAKVNPRTPKSMNKNVVVSGAGNMTIHEDCPFCGRLSVTLAMCR